MPTGGCARHSMRVFFSDDFDLRLPVNHRFPGQKYGMLRRKLIGEGIVSSRQLEPSPSADRSQIARAHAPGYIADFIAGRLPDQDMRRIGLPWSEHLVRRTHATMGGAVAAAHAALEFGLSGQLAGGTHHAHRDFGSGFCVFNDFAVAALDALAAGVIERAAIVDLDVHQGDGNAAILGRDPRVFVFSMHGAKNFPFRKHASDLDVALEDGAGDEAYSKALAEHLPAVFAFRPDLVLYQSGVDPLVHDRLGRLALSFEGLMQRDRMVLAECLKRGIPVSMAIGGGYADPIEHSVRAYANTYRVAKELHRF